MPIPDHHEEEEHALCEVQDKPTSYMDSCEGIPVLTSDTEDGETYVNRGACYSFNTFLTLFLHSS